MRIINVCPSTLLKGFNTYSPLALKKLFDGKQVSHIFPVSSPLSDKPETKEVFKNVGRISLSGVQTKLGAVIEGGCFRFSIERERSVFIVKPQPTSPFLYSKEDCPANENLTMQIAEQVYHIETAANALCFFENDECAYVTRRFDINPNGGKFSQEDFASLMGLTKANGGSDYKYSNGSYEDCADIIRKYVKASAVDILRLFRVVVFNFIYMNDDAHLKNFSLINRNGEYRLTPAYDLMNTSLHLQRPGLFALEKGLFKEGMQLSDIRTIRRKDFEEFGRRIGLPEKLVKRELDSFAAVYPSIKELIDSSFLSNSNQQVYYDGVNYRRKMLSL
jgi:serine/threonine-protein kinase HipA